MTKNTASECYFPECHSKTVIFQSIILLTASLVRGITLIVSLQNVVLDIVILLVSILLGISLQNSVILHQRPSFYNCILTCEKVRILKLY
jgi:hypothetical protein